MCPLPKLNWAEETQVMGTSESTETKRVQIRTRLIFNIIKLSYQMLLRKLRYNNGI